MSRTALGLRTVSSLRRGAMLVARPRGVVHLHAGALTRSGQSVPSMSRPLCGAITRRLRVVGRADALTVLTSRRLCRTCTRLLPYSTTPVRLDDEAERWADLTVADLTVAAAWCRTADETYQVGRVLRLVHGPAPIRPTTAAAQQLRRAHDAVNARRANRIAAERTPDEVAAIAAHRQAEDADRARVAAGRRRAAAHDKAVDRARRGQYLMPHERDLLKTG